MSIHYVTGDATNPRGEGVKFIVHICNDDKQWGSGFVMSLSRRWSEPKREYMKHMQQGGKLGQISFAEVIVNPEIWVMNMIAQQGVRGKNNHTPIRYGALQTCLFKASQKIKKHRATVHMPRIGCDRAGGNWQKVEQIIEETLGEFEVFVYDLPG